ncbi:GNAT family N-acetyltransferase [Achromobacter marplatensis]|jgi:RimJ/RimL family protein N-acetyltransferase|uniref:GNAT family N-acetyltransferase n=1 Tax=Achromobacter marplatensis TaxID=470868 RepID=UPI0028E3F4C8|nr:GNAT family N-acetyltransferase [Achromobacter marplatensis]
MLSTARLSLRPWCVDDAPSLFEHASDERIGPVAGWPVHTSLEYSRQVIETIFNHSEIYAVALQADDKAIGMVGLLIGKDSNFDIAEDEAEVAYWIGVPFWGQGLIPEAVKELMRHAFENLGIRALWCGYFADNEKSFKAQEKCGFRPHHTEENKFNQFLNDYRTEHISRITKEEWLTRWR